VTEDRKFPPFEYRIGRLSRDPEIKTTSKGEIVSLNLAVKQSFDDNDTEWVSVAVFSEKLQPKAKSLVKGNVIAVGGPLKRTPGRDGKEFVDLTAFILQRAVDIQIDESDDF